MTAAFHYGSRRHGGTGSRGILRAAAATSAVAIAAAGCGQIGVTAKPRLPARLTVSPVGSAAGIDPGAAVTVTAAHGRLREVVVRSASGERIEGELNAGASRWVASGRLAVDTRYTVTVTAVGEDGRRVTRTSSFTTLRPKATFRASTLLGSGRYGVGMPIVINFSRPVRDKAAMERALSLTTSVPVLGAWYWEGDKTVAFRPKDYWPSGTRVSFTGHFNGVRAAKGVYGTRDLSQSFTIGPSLIAYASARTHYMRVYYQGRLLGRWPISTGMPGYDTFNGAYLTIEKANPTFMKGPGYAQWVDWSVRFTWSGNYIHSAPWSVWAQGYTNVSHGCVNLAPALAEEYFKLESPGSPVIVTGSPAPGHWGDGWTEWFLTWPQLLAGSALGSAVQAGPDGSQLISTSDVLPRTPAGQAKPSPPGGPSPAGRARDQHDIPLSDLQIHAAAEASFSYAPQALATTVIQTAPCSRLCTASGVSTGAA